MNPTETETATETTPKRRDNTGVHTTHCCELHGCKYGDDDCPVDNRQAEQEYPCEMCMDMEELIEEMRSNAEQMALLKKLAARRR